MTTSNISVIIPCHNQGEYIKECLASVRAQTCPPKEIIIVDDGSTHPVTATAPKCLPNHPAMRIMRNATAQGLPAARNKAISECTADYILTLDADDKIARDYLELAADIIAKNPDDVIICGDGMYFGESKGPTHFPDFSPARMLVDNCIFSAAIFKKSGWLAAGGYNALFREGWEDWDFYLSLLENGAAYHHINKPVYYYRRHATNKTKSIDKNMELKTRLYKTLLGRHPRYLEKFAGESLLFCHTERNRHRALGRNPLMALSRKILRTFGKVPPPS